MNMKWIFCVDDYKIKDFGRRGGLHILWWLHVLVLVRVNYEGESPATTINDSL